MGNHSEENWPMLVFADDWGRHPSSCQHLVSRLLDRHPTVWVNTIGTRAPKFDLSTLRRGLGKVRQWLQRGSRLEVPERPRIINPRMWPWFTRKLDRWLNRKLLLRQLQPAVERMTQPPRAVTTLPIVADLMPHLPVRSWTYYCVDDFSKWPGLDRRTLGRMERLVIDRADGIITVSEHLQERIRRLGRDSELLTHGVDLEHWQNTKVTLPMLAGLEKPLIVFWGVIDRRMDPALLRSLASALMTGTILLVGPEQDPPGELFSLPRIVRPGALPFDELPALAQAASVLIMPYADLPVTRAMQPLKMKEYLATGKPVVVSNLPSTHVWRDCLDVATDPESFRDLVLRRLTSGLPSEQVYIRERLCKESWHAKASRFEQLLEQNNFVSQRC